MHIICQFLHIICNLTQINTGAAMGYSSVVLPVLTSNMSSIILNEMEVPLFGNCFNTISVLFIYYKILTFYLLQNINKILFY